MTPAVALSNASMGASGASSSSTTPQNTAPFTSLFLSLTRPIPSVSSYTPYTVLFQHSQQLHHRLIAAEPLTDDDKIVYQRANIMNPKERSLRDTHGGMLFIHQAWRECVSRCEGRVIF
eukprot:757636_1